MHRRASSPGFAPFPTRRLALFLLACAATVLSWAGAARAAPYSVAICTPSSAGDGLAYLEDNPGNIFLEPCGVQGPGLIHVGMPVNGQANRLASRSFRVTAPEGALIERIHYRAIPTRDNAVHSFLQWSLYTEGIRIQNVEDDRAFFPDADELSPRGGLPLGTRYLEAGVFCDDVNKTTCGSGGFLEITVQSLSAEFDDRVVPGFSQALFPTGLTHGTVPLGITGEDLGGGIKEIDLMVDGALQASEIATNGGACEVPYRAIQPCALTVPASFELDTTKLREGSHQMQYVITDAAGQSRESAPATFLVHNAPINRQRPTIEGSFQTGSPLQATTGSWENAPAAYAYQWFRCPAAVRGEGDDVKACGAIAGATGARYTPVLEDLGQRDLVQVTATNAKGAETSISLPTDLIQPLRLPPPPPPPPSKGKPVLSHLRLSRKGFRVGSTLAKQRGTILSFSCSRPGQLTIKIERRSRHGRGKVLGKLAAPIKAGRSKVLLSGEIGQRALRPGKYQVTLLVKGKNGVVSDPASLPFSILPG